MWKAAVKADPSFPTAWRNLGMALWNVRRDAKGAMAAYRKAMTADSTDARLVAEYDQLCEKCDQYAATWQPVADEIWASETHKKPAYENYTKEKREHPELAAFQHVS